MNKFAQLQLFKSMKGHTRSFCGEETHRMVTHLQQEAEPTENSDENVTFAPPLVFQLRPLETQSSPQGPVSGTHNPAFLQRCKPTIL